MNSTRTIIHQGSLPAGTYYVGDLCYVVPNENWGAYCDQSFPTDGSYHIGFFENYEGVGYATFGTMYGDGEYLDQFGRRYGVDSGSIGCIPTGALVEFNEEEARRLGNIIDFPTSFDCGYDDKTGTIRIGHIEIITGDYPEDEEDDYDYDSEDEE
jgi:hypothetical protein